MKTRNKQNQKTNFSIITTQRNENYKTFSLYHLKDNRLTIALKGFLTCLYALPNGWKITKRATSQYFGMGEATFQRYIKDLKTLGYIEIKKEKNNKAEYIIKEQSIKIDFNPRYIKQYTLEQINYFLNSKDLEPRYKNLIKKAYQTAEQEEIEFNKVIKELEEQEPTSNENDIKSMDDELPF